MLGRVASYPRQVAALWIATASWHATGAIRWIGVFVAVDFACYSLLILLSPLAFLVALPSLVLLPVWFLLLGRRFAREQAHPMIQGESGGPHASLAE